MKAIDSIRNKIKKPSRSTALFWVGSLIALLAAFLPLITGAQWVLFLVAVVGFALSGSQKIVGDREQRQQLEQERKRNEAIAQRVWNDTPSGRQHAALSQLKTEMHMDSQEPHS